jgi:hypothetical protein
MLVTAGKYTDLSGRAWKRARPARPAPGQSPFHFFIRHARTRNEPISAWFERELRTGGLLEEYLRREKWQTEERLRRVARRVQHMKPNPKSDVQLVAKVPARDYHRWRGVDKDFWRDNNNLKSLRRDNDALRPCIFV